MKDTNSQSRWNDKWDNDDKNNRYVEEHDILAQIIQPYLKNEIADLGCGNGMMTSEHGGHVWGIDHAMSGIVRAIELNPAGTYLTGDARKTPWPDKMFDTVLLSEILEHFADFQPLMDEAKRLCRGHIVVTVPWNSRGNEHYHPHWPLPYAARVLSYMGEVIELRRIKHPKGFWVLGYVEAGIGGL